MILKPDDNWLWQFDIDASTLSLKLGDEFEFQPYLPVKKMVAIKQPDMAFSLDDTTIYYQLLEQLSDHDLPNAIKVHWILNAITAIRFHKPLMPQSWFYATQAQRYQPQQGELVELVGKAFHGAQYLVLEACEQTSLCMLIEREHFLSAQKTLQQFDVIKVMNDRVSSLQQTEFAISEVC